MAIIDHNKPTAKDWMVRLIWFIGLWVVSVSVLTVVALAIRSVIGV